MAGQPKTRAKRALENMPDEPAEIRDPNVAQTTEPDTGAAKGDRPPRASRGSGRRAPSPASGGGAASDRRTPSLRKIHDGLTQSFMLAGLGVSLWDPFDGQVVALNADKLADAWTDLAAQNATVKRNLERILQGGAWGTAIGTTAMVAIPILVRHGFAPMDLAVMAAGNGVKIPDVFSEPPPPTGDEFPPVAPDVMGTPPPVADDGAPPRHPMDGSPTEADLNGEAQIFPRSEPA